MTATETPMRDRIITREQLTEASRWPVLDLGEPGAAPGEAAFEWILHGLLERGSRMLLAGDEGTGKSLCLGQLAVRLAAGLPCVPGDEPRGPLRVLVIDTELNERTIRRRLRPMVDHANLPAGQLFYVLAPAGINLLNPDDKTAFDSLCRLYRPHLVIIDSLYRAFIGDPDDPRIGGEVQRVLDETRARTGAALLLACHYRKRSNDGRHRRSLDDLAGSRVWKAWPETVVDLTKTELRVKGMKDREGLGVDLSIDRADAGAWEINPDGWPFTFTAKDNDDQPAAWHGHTLIQSYALAVLARGDEALSTNQVCALITEQRHTEGHKSGFHRTNVTAALGELEGDTKVRSEIGARNAKLWRITPAGITHISTDQPEQETTGW